MCAREESEDAVHLARFPASLALVNLSNVTNGANWTKKWVFTEPMSLWNGVFLNEQGRVTSLDLTNNKDNVSEVVSRFKGLGSSSIWDALNDTFDLIEVRNLKERGAVMLLITDALEADSKLAFGNLLNRVKENEILFFPIQLPTDYLDEDPAASKKRLKIAGRALELLAEDSGGEYFNIKNENEVLWQRNLRG